MESGNILTPNNGSYLPVLSLCCLVPRNNLFLAIEIRAPTQSPQISLHSAAPDITAFFHVMHFLTFRVLIPDCAVGCRYMYLCDQPILWTPKLELQKQSDGCFPLFILDATFIFTVYDHIHFFEMHVT